MPCHRVVIGVDRGNVRCFGMNKPASGSFLGVGLARGRASGVEADDEVGNETAPERDAAGETRGRGRAGRDGRS
jgi:hypothetical protein